jgi:hypothetical protein
VTRVTTDVAGLIGGLGGAAALLWAVTRAIDRLVRTVGELAITYRAVFSADDRHIQRLRLVLGAGEPADGRVADLGRALDPSRPGPQIDARLPRRPGPDPGWPPSPPRSQWRSS